MGKVIVAVFVFLLACDITVDSQTGLVTFTHPNLRVGPARNLLDALEILSFSTLRVGDIRGNPNCDVIIAIPSSYRQLIPGIGPLLINPGFFVYGQFNVILYPNISPHPIFGRWKGHLHYPAIPVSLKGFQAQVQCLIHYQPQTRQGPREPWKMRLTDFAPTFWIVG